MKSISRIVLIMVCFFSLFMSKAMADYPDYLNGDHNYVICGGHMGYGCYIDRSSLVVQKYEPPIYIIAVRLITVADADRGNTAIEHENIARFMYNWETRKMYQLHGDSWHYIKPVGSMAETGHYFAGELAFYMAYHMKFYGGKKWLNPSTNRYESPNFGDGLYVPVDGV